ncbi:MAG: hypothetical protein Q9160_006445 [Pyrenula sp. 1 TL-2023]
MSRWAAITRLVVERTVREVFAKIEAAAVKHVSVKRAQNAQGSDVVGTYELQTLTHYTSLREEATITATKTTTDSDGKTSIETVLAVVAEAGVAWFLGYVGDAAAAAALTPKAPATPPENADDPSCPAQHDKCDDCGGTEGFCTNKDAGCACDSDDKKCPTGDEQPKCSDATCSGNDGKCTLGDNKDCECAKADCPTGDEMPECSDDKCKGQDEKCTEGENKDCSCKAGPGCPEPRYTPYCDYCGDKGEDGKCKGLKEKSDLWKGCECLDEPEVIEKGDQTPLVFDPDTLPTESVDTYSYGGSDPLKCQNLEWGAPRDKLEQSIKDWCKDNNGKEIEKTPEADTIYDRVGYRTYSYWLAAAFEEGGNCGDSAKIEEVSCSSTMHKMLDFCNIGQETFNGAELKDDCVKYQLTFSASTTDESPPWNELPPSQLGPSCPDPKIEISEVTYNFFAGLTKSYCDAVDKDPGKALTKTLTNKDFQDTTATRRRGANTLLARTPPSSGSDYEGYSFEIKWDGNPDNKHCLKDCTGVMQSFVNACGHVGNEQNIMQKTASYDVACGKYSYEIEDPPATYQTEPLCGGSNDAAYPFFDQFPAENIPLPDNDDMYTKLCDHFTTDDVTSKDPANHAYGHWNDFGVYLNYGIIDNGLACTATGGPRRFRTDHCVRSIKQITPSCTEDKEDVGGAIAYRCFMYSLRFRNWDDVEKTNVDL